MATECDDLPCGKLTKFVFAGIIVVIGVFVILMIASFGYLDYYEVNVLLECFWAEFQIERYIDKNTTWSWILVIMCIVSKNINR